MKNKILLTLSIILSIIVVFYTTKLMDMTSTISYEFNENVRTCIMLFNMGIMFSAFAFSIIVVYYFYKKTVTNNSIIS